VKIVNTKTFDYFFSYHDLSSVFFLLKKSAFKVSYNGFLEMVYRTLVSWTNSEDIFLLLGKEMAIMMQVYDPSPAVVTLQTN